MYVFIFSIVTLYTLYGMITVKWDLIVAVLVISFCSFLLMWPSLAGAKAGAPTIPSKAWIRERSGKLSSGVHGWARPTHPRWHVRYRIYQILKWSFMVRFELYTISTFICFVIYDVCVFYEIKWFTYNIEGFSLSIKYILFYIDISNNGSFQSSRFLFFSFFFSGA